MDPPPSFTIVLQRVLMGWAPHKSANKEVWVLFQVFPHLAMFTVTQCPINKLVIRHTLMCNASTSDFTVRFWWHTTLWKVPCHHEYGVAHDTPVLYTKLPYNNLQWSMTRSFLHQICIRLCLSQLNICTLYTSCTADPCLRVGTHLSELWPCTGNWSKSGMWPLFHMIMVLPLFLRKKSTILYSNLVHDICTVHECWQECSGRLMNLWRCD